MDTNWKQKASYENHGKCRSFASFAYGMLLMAVIA